MNIQTISQNVIRLILQYLRFEERKSLIFLSKTMSIKILHCIMANLVEFHCPLVLPDLSDFSRLSRLSIYLSSIRIDEVKHIIQLIPGTVLRLKLQLHQTIAQQIEFLQCLAKYQPQVTHIKLVIMGQGFGTNMTAITNNHVSNQVEAIYHTFYIKMHKLMKFKVDTHEVCNNVSPLNIQNQLFFALFFKGEQQLSIKSIEFDHIVDLFEQAFSLMNPNQFFINTTITSISLKQYHARSQHNLIDKLNYLCYLFGQQVNKINLTQNYTSYGLLQDQQICTFVEHFINLESLRINVYSAFYQLESFQINDLSHLFTLNTLGLSSLHVHPTHLLAMLTNMELISINLDFTLIDDQCLDVICKSCIQNSKLQKSQRSMFACTALTKKALIQFIAKQRSLINLDIRKLHCFGIEAFKELNTSTELQKLKIQDNEIDNMTMIALLKKHCFSVNQLYIDELMHNQNLTDDVFEMAIQNNILCLSLIELQIQFIHHCFKVSTLSEIVKIFPNIRTLNVKLNLAKYSKQLFEILAKARLMNLEKLILQDCSQECSKLNIGEIVQYFRDNTPRLNTVTVNSEQSYILNQFEQTKGNRPLRLVILQQRDQKIL